MIVHVNRISGRNRPCFEGRRLDGGSVLIHISDGRRRRRLLTLVLVIIAVLVRIGAGCCERCGIGCCVRIYRGLQSSLPSGLPPLYLLHEDLWARGGFLRRGPLLGV